VVSESLRARLEQRIEDYLAAASPANMLRHIAAARRALPLYTDIGGASLLSTDGEVWDFPWDAEQAEQVTGRERMLALVIGAERFPELKELLPVRPASAPDCPECEGTGKFGLSGSSGQVMRCPDCAGLGWLQKEFS
jgi:hypothetical protein